MIISAIKVTQPLGEFYIAKIKARDLLKVSTSSVLRYDKDGTLKGNQRPLKSDRLKAIANFIRSEEMCFPTSIIVAANIDDSGEILEDEDRRWKIERINNDLYQLDIPNQDNISSLIIDGQHRLKSFELTSDEFKDIELVCSIFFDLPMPYQAYLFATINGNQKKVDKSLALELFGFNVENEPENTWSPEKLAVYLTRKLNFSKDSPLYQKIKLAPLFTGIEEIVDRSKWILSTAAMVEGILGLISTYPQLDRDTLAFRKDSFWGDKTRRILKEDKTVLREWYLNNKDEKIYEVLISYFSSINKMLWSQVDSNSVIFKTIGISALFDLLKAILEKDRNISNFDQYINKINNIDYLNNYFSLSGAGKTRLKRVLKFKVGLITEADLKKEDKAFV